MNATDVLLEDHKHVRRLEQVVDKCQKELYRGTYIPLSDIEIITRIISEFLDSIHHAREENSYFACVSSYNSLKDEIRTFLIEHEFGRRIATNITKYLQDWKAGKDSREPVARYLRTYAIYLNDHLQKEDKFFTAATSILSEEEEQEMYEQFRSVMAITKKIDVMIKEIDELETRSWYTA